MWVDSLVVIMNITLCDTALYVEFKKGADGKRSLEFGYATNHRSDDKESVVGHYVMSYDSLKEDGAAMVEYIMQALRSVGALPLNALRTIKEWLMGLMGKGKLDVAAAALSA